MAPEERGRATSTKSEDSTDFGRGGDDENDDVGGDGIIDGEDGVLRPRVGRSKRGRRLVVVLTLARHVDGVWITRLMSELRRRFSDQGHRDYEPVVVTLEDLLRPGVDDDDRGVLGLRVDGIPEEWACVVNRVSDAATPSEVKSCLAVLRMVEIWGLSVYNGPKSYSIGCNKLLHHHVFARAGLTTPRSVPVRLGLGMGGAGTVVTKESAEEELMLASKLLREEKGATYPFLVKPNSAGFGAGIELFHSADDLAAYARRIDAEKGVENRGAVGDGTGGSGAVVGPSNDGMALLQEYLKPSGGCVYRVWFLDGRVQCATRREVEVIDEEGNEVSNKDRLFTGGCAGSGGVCALPPRTLRVANKKPSGDQSVGNRFRQQPNVKDTRRVQAWRVPREVEVEIMRIVKVVGDDCHAGSVEFLFDSNKHRVYFDLNMLSTLPIHDDGSVEASDEVWKESSFDPWAELADSIARMVLDGDGHEESR